MKRTVTKSLMFFLGGFFLVSALIFIPAGTINYFGGVLLLCILFIPMLISGIIMLIKVPSLLESRLELREKQKEQGTLIALSGILFLLGFISAGIDFRFGISAISPPLQIIASVIFLFGYFLYFIVLFQNKYLSRTIKVTDNQKVIDTGLYSVIRHPMYTATIIMFLSIQIVLGSFVSFVIFLVYPIIIVRRIRLEEMFLEEALEGYKEYREKVKYKLFPFIW